jgi:manganese oxidase
MRSLVCESSHRRRRTRLGLTLPILLFASSLAATPGLSAEGSGDQSHSAHATPVAMPGWAQQLKGQTVVENAIEGRAENPQQMEMQHHRLMQKLEQQAQKDAQAQHTSGAFNEMSMMHQYMGQDGSSFLLMTDSGKGEPVMTAGGDVRPACRRNSSISR